MWGVGGSYPERRIPAGEVPPRGILLAGHRQGRGGLRGTYPSEHSTPSGIQITGRKQGREGLRGAYPSVHPTPQRAHSHYNYQRGDGLYLKDVYLCRPGTKCSASLFLVGGAGTLGKRSPFHIPCLFLILPPPKKMVYCQIVRALKFG